MAVERFPIIYLDGPDRTLGYTSPQSGGSSPRIPQRDRVSHAEWLTARFADAWSQAQERRAVPQQTRHGVYLEFESSPGFQLMLKSLEREVSGIRLLNVRRMDVDGAEQTLATVYVPDAKRAYFLNKIGKYASEETDRGVPKNAKLVDGIADVKAAVVESFWRPGDLESIPGAGREWLELWVRDDEGDALASVDATLDELRVVSGEGVLRFPERTVRLVHMNRVEIELLVQATDLIAEFRPATAVATDVLVLNNEDQAQIAKELLDRSTFEASDVAVCVLDTGVNNGHPLLLPILRDADMHTVREEWGAHDHHGHGTLMAGTAAYGDLLDAIESGRHITIGHSLESSKILPPGEENPKHLWGDITAQAISRAEIQAPGRTRINCLATTSLEDRYRGFPSSWSAAVDELASGYLDDKCRLIVVAAGNADYASFSDYPVANETDEVHDPAQAWNALTVGAYTRLVNITDKNFEGYQAIASAGALSPHSTTSLNWTASKWPIKPEVLFEGGNVARDAAGFVSECDDLKLLSTSRNPRTSMFAPFSQTSAASAQAAEMAARFQVAYPSAWPETVRGLIVHSAEWTEAMCVQFPASSKQDFARRARRCGYGVPDFERAAYCFRNSLTLVSEAALQPFELRGTTGVTKDMHFYDLPWPAEVLASLGGAPVEMRVTLSYFVEPSPGEVGWQDRYRYASHGLRFAVNGPGESEAEFIQRINRQSREEESNLGTQGPGDRWAIGRARDVGSIHSDIWMGTAADLAASNRIAIYPTIGWWRERKSQNRVSRQTRYSLIVSIRTPQQDVDIYTPVTAQIGIPISIPGM